jgi:hypothetical protein
VCEKRILKKYEVKKIIAILLFIAAVADLRAQQLPLYSNYMLNDYPMNPAIGGTHPYFEAMSNNRYQWIGITDAPRTYMLSVDGPTKIRMWDWAACCLRISLGPQGAQACIYHMHII